MSQAGAVSASDDLWKAWTGRDVVVDVASPYVVLGVLRDVPGPYLVLDQADVHDLRDSKTTREQYVVDAQRHGVRVNRRTVMLRLDNVVAVSLLDDVVDEER